MYAIIEDSGTQLKVEEGQEVAIDLRSDANEGDEVTFDKILTVVGDDGPQFGAPHLSGATVTATVLGTFRDKKILVQKFRRRKTYRKKQGHRQKYTLVKIGAISLG
ncbi:50S ribosomal subunit protein L21 [Planctomycetales bacterium 10988]|nr:50S ribosomal subunit protein L21 [Planctomycetales bacterium 10988]